MRIPFQISVEQQQLSAMLHVPEDGLKSKQIVVMCYGFNGYRCDVHRIGLKFSEYLEQWGMASVRVDYRGQGNSLGQMEYVDFSTRTKDIISTIDFLQGVFNNPCLDIALVGFSDGARIAIEVQKKQPIKTIVFWNPILSTQNTPYTSKTKGRKNNSVFRNSKNKQLYYSYYGLPVSISYLSQLTDSSFEDFKKCNCDKYCVWGKDDSFTANTREILMDYVKEYYLVEEAEHLFFGEKLKTLFLMPHTVFC